jgi:hypothetical protein
MGVGETITVINRSGKVVSNVSRDKGLSYPVVLTVLQSKHLISVFKEAKSAYRERKAEIKAERDVAYQEKNLHKSIKTLRIDDDTRSRASSHHSERSKGHRSKPHKHTSHRERPPVERGYTDSFYVNDSPSKTRRRSEHDLAGDAQDAHRMELTRRNTDMNLQRSSMPEGRRRSDTDIDMDLAYGEIPPPLPVSKYDDGELKEKASKINMLLDEANCLQYSVTAMIENLQKNPEALAAVSLTLAEISSIVGKMGPGVLLTLKGSFPAVAALLLSPQFMIAGGVAVGVTIVALGGYKIIKKIQANKEEREAMPMAHHVRVDSGLDEPQLDELAPEELSRVEMWRRGIAEVEAESAGTSVDGEFVTPGATRHLIAAGVLDEEDVKSRRGAKNRDERPRAHRARSERSSKTTKVSDTKRSKTVKESSSKKREKEPSGLKMLFRSHTAH